MANDGGKTSRIEEWMVSVAAALTHNSKTLFKTVEVWKHQISIGQSGIESFDKYAPFAFCFYGGGDGRLIGDGDLHQEIIFGILFGQKSKYPGIARIGDANHAGTSIMRDKLIDAFINNHPGEGFDCDDFKYGGELEMLDKSTQHMVRLNLRLPWTT